MFDTVENIGCFRSKCKPIKLKYSNEKNLKFWRHFIFHIDRDNFPAIWKDIEKGLAVSGDELVPVKTVLNHLGYTTKASILTLNKNAISNLENEYLKANNDHTKVIKFTSGFKANLASIVQLLRSETEYEMNKEKIQTKIYQQAEKVKLRR